MRSVSSFDRTVAVTTLLLVGFGLIILYSAGQTDVPTRAAGVWFRQLVWSGIGFMAALLVYQVSPRILEWVAPALYGFGILLLLVVLAVGTGAGTAESSHSWLSIGGRQIGQPSEFAKIATVLMLARHLSGLREPPRSLRDLLVPSIIVGVPFLLVLKQPDLGSALVFVGILFAMLFWAGARPLTLFLLASPGFSLLLGFSTLGWTLWMIALFAILVFYRPYILDSVVCTSPTWSWVPSRSRSGAGCIPTSRTGCSPSSIPRSIRRRPATMRSSRRWPSDRAGGSAPATPRGHRSASRSCRSSTPTSCFPWVVE